MRKNASLPVRLDTNYSARLDAIADKLKLNKSVIIRMLAEHFVDQYEKNGGRMVIPPEYRSHDQKGNGK